MHLATHKCLNAKILFLSGIQLKTYKGRYVRPVKGCERIQRFTRSFTYRSLQPFTFIGIYTI